MYHKYLGTYPHIYMGIVRWIVTALFSMDSGRERIGDYLEGY